MRLPFTVTAGPYAGKYNVDTDEYSGSDAHRFRQALGFPAGQVSGGNVDVDVFCGFVWIEVLRRGKSGLPFQAVADNITASQIDVDADEVKAQNAKAPEPDPEDPTTGGEA